MTFTKKKKGHELLPKGRKTEYCIIDGGKEFATRQRRDIMRKMFNNRYACRKCGKRDRIQIHHLYQYAPSDKIDDYNDFLQIPWIPLCINCHMSLHGVTAPDETEDD